MDTADLPSFVRIGGDDPEPVADAPAPAADPAPAAEPAPQPDPQPAADPAPAEGGDPAPAPAADPAPQPDPAADPAKAPPGFVPVGALHEARRRIDELERRPAAAPQPQPQAVEPPDPEEDPEGHQAWQRQQDDLRLVDMKMHFSERTARLQYGDELVTAVQQAAARRMERDPAFRAQVQNHPDPYSFVIADYQRYKTLQTVGGDPDAFAIRRAAELGFVKPVDPAPAAAAAASPKPQAPRSIAAAPSASMPAAPAHYDGQSTFEQMFARK